MPPCGELKTPQQENFNNIFALLQVNAENIFQILHNFLIGNPEVCKNINQPRIFSQFSGIFLKLSENVCKYLLEVGRYNSQFSEVAPEPS